MNGIFAILNASGVRACATDQLTQTSKWSLGSEDAMFDNLFLMLGPTTLAFVLGPLLLAVGVVAASPACPLDARGGRPLAR